MDNDPLIVRIRAARKRLLSMHLPATVALYPLEVCIGLWGLFAGFTAGIPTVTTPSNTLANLPDWAEESWGVAMFIASLTIAAALRPSGTSGVRLALLARGLMFASLVLLSFGIAILGIAGWPRLLSGILLILVGVAGLIRASKHKIDYYAVLEEATITHANGNGGPAPAPKEG